MLALLLPALLLLAIVAGSLVYCVLTIIAAIRYRAVKPPELRERSPISILKPLSALEPQHPLAHYSCLVSL